MNLNFDETLKRATADLTKVLNEFITKVKSTGLDPLTIPTEATSLEASINALIGREIDTLKNNLPIVSKATFAAMKSTWKTDFLTQNSGKNGPVGLAFDAVVDVLFAQRERGEQVLRGGKVVKPFSLKIGAETRTYGEPDLGCYTGDYYDALVDVIRSRRDAIVQTLVRNIANKTFA